MENHKEKIKLISNTKIKMETKLTEDNFNRLAISIMTKYSCTYEEAMERLSNFKLNLVCNDSVAKSLPLQAALLTSINSGKRAFLGGVIVVLKTDVDCLLPWSEKKKLHEIAVELGAILGEKANEEAFTITLGFAQPNNNNSMQLICNSWQGGIAPSDENVELPISDQLPLGGIAAGAIAVGNAFLKISGIHIEAGNYPTCISLWRPDLDWLNSDAFGPEVKSFPQRYWLLGLGHLGQAYLWNIGLLGYKNTSEVLIMLQDYDKAAEANYSAGLLCDHKNVGEFKTRLSAAWLEKRGFKTCITERMFDANTKRTGEEPYVALCGFDSGPSRVHLEDSGFDLIVEAALGGNLSMFDNISLHTFPTDGKSSKDIWKNAPTEEEINQNTLKQFAHLEEKGCGILATALANKAISSSFVGALTGSLVVAELLRALNSGRKYNIINAQVRSLEYKTVIPSKKENYDTELSRNGSVLI